MGKPDYAGLLLREGVRQAIRGMKARPEFAGASEQTLVHIAEQGRLERCGANGVSFVIERHLPSPLASLRFPLIVGRCPACGQELAP